MRREDRDSEGLTLGTPTTLGRECRDEEAKDLPRSPQHDEVKSGTVNMEDRTAGLPNG